MVASNLVRCFRLESDSPKPSSYEAKVTYDLKTDLLVIAYVVVDSGPLVTLTVILQP